MVAALRSYNHCLMIAHRELYARHSANVFAQPLKYVHDFSSKTICCRHNTFAC
jgi:hypothetical protein